MDTIQYIPPQHYTLTNVGLLLKKYPINKLLLTEKIDGVYNCGSINEVICQYESLDNRKFIFNSNNIIILEPKNFNEFKKMLNEFNISTINKEIINKPYFRLNLNILQHIDEIINYEHTYYQTDGWILASEDLKILLKLKPIKHMTIDLYYNNKIKRWFTRENKVIDIKEYNISSGIWRLAWENSNWIPKNIRYDKNKANQYKIVKYIIDFINKPFSLYQLILTILSTNLYYSINNKIKSNDTIIYINNNNSFIKDIIKKYCNENFYVLDIGCGKGKYIIKNTHWFGIDIDLGSLNIPERFYNFYGLWLDFTIKWDPIFQEKKLGKLWNFYRNKLFELKNNKFDLILLFYSLHFCQNINELTNVFDEINNVTKKGSIIIFNLIKNNFDNIIFSNGYIKRHNNTIHRFYEWCNDKETIEYIWNIDDILKVSKLWSIKDIISFPQLFNDETSIDAIGWNEWNKNNYIYILCKNF